MHTIKEIDKFFEDNKSFIKRKSITGYNLFRMLIQSDIMTKREFEPLKEEIIMFINQSTHISALFLKNELISQEKKTNPWTY